LPKGGATLIVGRPMVLFPAGIRPAIDSRSISTPTALGTVRTTPGVLGSGARPIQSAARVSPTWPVPPVERAALFERRWIPAPGAAVLLMNPTMLIPWTRLPPEPKPNLRPSPATVPPPSISTTGGRGGLGFDVAWL